MKNKRYLSENPICGIYSIKNKINNKIYIGQSIDIERRWYQHKYGKGNIIVRNAIKKYGLVNFEFTILEKLDVTNKTKNKIIELLTDVEQKYFNEYEPFKKEKGYNINKISKPNLTPNKSKNFGQLISKIKIDNNHCGKPVIQYNLNGEKIKEWKSAAQIERNLGYKSENISSVCLGKNYTSNDFIWRFKGHILTEKEIYKTNRKKNNKTINQYNLKGELIYKYKNINEVFNKTGIKKTLILSVCNNIKKNY